MQFFRRGINLSRGGYGGFSEGPEASSSLGGRGRAGPARRSLGVVGECSPAPGHSVLGGAVDASMWRPSCPTRWSEGPLPCSSGHGPGWTLALSSCRPGCEGPGSRGTARLILAWRSRPTALSAPSRGGCARSGTCGPSLSGTRSGAALRPFPLCRRGFSGPFDQPGCREKTCEWGLGGPQGLVRDLRAGWGRLCFRLTRACPYELARISSRSAESVAWPSAPSVGPSSCIGKRRCPGDQRPTLPVFASKYSALVVTRTSSPDPGS